MCICVYIYLHMCTYIYTHICTHTYIHALTHTDIQTYRHTYRQTYQQQPLGFYLYPHELTRFFFLLGLGRPGPSHGL